MREVSPGHYVVGLADSPGQAAAAPAAPGPAPQAPADASWVSELPTAEVVRNRVRGAAPAETGTLRDAALEVMKLYINVRCNQNVAVVGATEGVPIAAAQRFEEYRRLQTPPPTIYDPVISPQAQAYYRLASFQHQVLSALIPEASVAVYESTPVFQELAQEEARNQPQGSPLANLRAAAQALREEGAEAETVPEGPNNRDQYGGYTDPEGNYHDKFGGIYDGCGYLAKDGSYKSKYRYTYDPKTDKVFDESGSEVDTSDYKDSQERIGLIRIHCAVADRHRAAKEREERTPRGDQR